MVVVDGLRLRTSVAGPRGGTPLLLVSGIGAPLELWDPFRRALGTETVAIDLPGVGQSDTMRLPRSMWGIARLLDRVVDRLGYGTVDVLGLSWGGGVAQHLALIAKKRVRRLMLVSTGFGLWSIPGDPRAAVQLLTPARYFSRRHFESVGPSLYGGEIRRHPELLKAQATVRKSRKPTTLGYIHQLVAASTWVGLPMLPFIRNDTLVLIGDDDPIVHTATARIMASALPNATLRIVPGGGHLMLLDQARDAAAIVRDFREREG